ncbi:uracil-DNA glycosylase [Aulographum hederae CBS 113979]|uniref:Uracil-DNA glycosylase n=1 Tax=Aulographum hederae CBS 113979 TaxID=1176131 RepID=A0A6G1H5K0_9PEZI|nr:uracil-DNA glycosylase [Aulographum hederae CBS 113979]
MSLKRKAADVAAAAEAKKPKNASITSFFGTVGAPKSSPASSSPAAPANTPIPQPATSKFNKDAWVAKLTEEQRNLLALEINTLHDSWLAHLKDEITSKEFLDLKRFLQREAEAGKTIFPPSKDVYSWSRHTPLNTVKAVILGQDPYHNVNQAHGLCFSVLPPTKPPPSLVNIYKALTVDYPDFSPPPNNSGLLTPWADRGVLLLNTCLTVRAHEANSHAGKGWERFTQKVIDTVSKTRTKGVVFLAWGNPAAKRVDKIRLPHVVLKSVHPSPLSASKGWFQCGHFKKTNAWLKEHHGEGSEIDWNLDVDPAVAGT